MTVSPLFSIPIYSSNIGVDPFDLEFIKSLPYDSSRDKKHFAWIYNKENVIFNKHLNFLRKKINNCIREFLFDELRYRYFLKFKISDSWALRLVPSKDQVSHSHANALYCGCYYLQVPDGDIVFSRPKSVPGHSVMSLRLEQDISELSGDQWDTHTFKVKEGDVLIWPAYVPHGISKNYTSQDRYSLAFNIVPTGQLYNMTYDSGPVEPIGY